MSPRAPSTRISRRSRTVLGIVAIAAAFWMIWVFGINAPYLDGPKPTMKSERGVALKLADLKTGEEIVIVRIPYRGAPMEFRFRPTRSGVTLILSQLEWENSAHTKLVRVLFARDLASAEVAGIDAVTDFLRRHQRAPSRMHANELRIEHLRNGAVIGRESLEEGTLLNEWTTARGHSSDDPESLRRLEDAAREAGLSLEDLKRWVTFEMLLEEESAPASSRN